MNKVTYFLEALKAQAHHNRAWVIRAFSLFQEDPESWRADNSVFRLVHTPSGYFFVHPDNKGNLSLIEGADPARPLFTAFETLTVEPKTVGFFPDGGLTTYGNLLFNAVVFSAVGNKLGFFNESVNMGAIEARLAEMIIDDPKDGSTVPDGKITVSEYLRFCNAIGYLQEFTQLFTQGLTEKAVTPPPGLAEKKAELLKRYEGMINDPLTQTKIYNELVAFDAAYLKGDPSERFLISGKSRSTVRRKLFLMQGAEPGLTNSQELPLITNSLVEGWQKEKIPQMIDVLRAGSFDRGSETELGGVEAKWIMRSTSNVRVVDKDCETKLGKVTLVRKRSAGKLVGRYITLDNKPVLISTPEQAEQLVGQTVTVRAPHYCAYKYTDYCSICLGVKLASNKDGVSMAATARGGGFLGIFLGAMHAKVMQSARLDVESAFT